MRRRQEREMSIKMRLGGKSYGEISRALGIPKSTLHGWLFDRTISDSARERIEGRTHARSLAALIKRNVGQTKLAQSRAKQTRESAAQRVGTLSKKDLLNIGAVLYWAEGYKKSVVKNGKEVTHHVVSLTNSDPALAKMFLRFLREYCEVPEERIKADIRIFEHQNEELLLDFWQKETGISRQNFGKTYYGISKSSQSKRPYDRLPYGVIQIRVGSTELFHHIMGYIEGLKKLV
jgi:hypothetical protein